MHKNTTKCIRDRWIGYSLADLIKFIYKLYL